MLTALWWRTREYVYAGRYFTPTYYAMTHFRSMSVAEVQSRDIGIMKARFV